jgi:hypothetical protein
VAVDEPIKEADYPALWRSSDAAAAAFQRSYFFRFKAHLLLLGATTVVSAWSPPFNSLGDRAANAVVAVLMLVALILTLVLRYERWDDRWFQARAIAENVKASAWRYMMLPDFDDAAYLAELQKIRERSSATKHLAPFNVGTEEITPRMRQVKSSTTASRTVVYRTQRLEDQITWYRDRASRNAVAESRWSRAVLVFETAAVLVAASRFTHPLQQYNPIGPIAAVAAGMLGWAQAKKFSDLANTYLVASQDLVAINSRKRSDDDEAVLKSLVIDVESAISREHRLWVERRT